MQILSVRSIGLAALLVESGTATTQVPDRILYDAKCLTVENNLSAAAAIAVRGERIVAVGRDEFYAGDKSDVVGSLNRLDHGEDYVDHHAFFCIRGDKSGLNHLPYEAADIDDVMVGHECLQQKCCQHMWGIGRHLIGSQLFDYRADPWGRVREHWADTDVLNAHTPLTLMQALSS
jgi:hypothetical protein